MSAEKIIQQIEKDAQKEIKEIHKTAELQVQKNLATAKKEAEIEAEKIIQNGQNQSENLKRILISKANQNAKKEVMNAREKIINECFIKAQQKFAKLKGQEYENIIKKLIEDGCKKLGKDCLILKSREEDKKITQNFNIKITGKVESSGGIVIKSADGKIVLDNTFEGIVKRKKEKIRVEIGKLLFS